MVIMVKARDPWGPHLPMNLFAMDTFITVYYLFYKMFKYIYVNQVVYIVVVEDTLVTIYHTEIRIYVSVILILS